MDDQPGSLTIAFSPEADGTYHRIIEGMAAYVVRVTPYDPECADPEPYDVEIVGPDYDADDFTTIRARRYNNDTDLPEGPELSISVKSLYVY